MFSYVKEYYWELFKYKIENGEIFFEYKMIPNYIIVIVPLYNSFYFIVIKEK